MKTTSEERAELRSLFQAHTPGIPAATAGTIVTLLDDLDDLTAKLDLVRAEADWHETKAMKAREYPGVGAFAKEIAAKATQVHADAARRLLAILDADGDLS